MHVLVYKNSQQLSCLDSCGNRVPRHRRVFLQVFHLEGWKNQPRLARGWKWVWCRVNGENLQRVEKFYSWTQDKQQRSGWHAGADLLGIKFSKAVLKFCWDIVSADELPSMSSTWIYWTTTARIEVWHQTLTNIMLLGKLQMPGAQMPVSRQR